MGSSLMRVFASTLAFVLTAAPALACDATETFLYSCQTDAPERSLSLCATEADSGDGLQFTGVRFVYQTEKGEEIAFPANPADGPKQLFFSHQFKAGLYQASIRFEKDGERYRLLFKDGPEQSDPSAPGAGSGGLEITAAGKPVRSIACSEPPAFYYDQTRALLACDLENMFGAAGCGPKAPEEP